MPGELHARIAALKSRVAAFHGTHNQKDHGNHGGGGGGIGWDPDYSKGNWANSLGKRYDKVRERYPDPTNMGRDELNYKMQERGNDPDYTKLVRQSWDISTAFPQKSWEERHEQFKSLRRKIHMFWNKNMNSD